jgi:CubicO group peptidase (beta-lactamase class C family)
MRIQRGITGVVLLSAIVAGCANIDARDDARGFGVSGQRLKQLSAQISAEAQSGAIPGAVILVARNGKIVYTDAIGLQNPSSGVPMKPDSIFRLASMTKPIVSVAAMMLVEEGKLSLDDPISKYLPELKGLKVGVEKKDAAGNAVLEEVAAVREMTVQDLLRHTSGFTYGIFGKSLVKQRYRDTKMEGDRNQTNAEHVGRLAKLPLAYQPGTTWEYSRSTDVLGAVIERVTGQTLDVFLSERILKPLSMKDTGFSVDPAKHGRIAEPFAVDPDTKAPVLLPDVRTPPRFLCGGACMVSTATDYYRFLQMLLNGGELDGVRMLSRKSVELMTSDHLGTRITDGPGPGYGFGLGFAVRIMPGEASTLGSVGDYGWAGLYGTTFFVDPKERLIGILLMQRPNYRKYSRQFRTGVYSALDIANVRYCTCTAQCIAGL